MIQTDKRDSADTACQGVNDTPQEGDQEKQRKSRQKRQDEQKSLPGGALRWDFSVRKSVMEHAYESYLREDPFNLLIQHAPVRHSDK